MKKKKDNSLNTLIDSAKTKIDETLDNFAELETCLELIKKENLIAEKRTKLAEQEVKREKLAVRRTIKETEKQYLQHSEPFPINQRKYFVLPNIENKIEEAVTDAIRFFEKKCPYCDINLYGGHLRNKIEIDHFIPISKGGQHVPWNILPVCKKCNRTKSAKTAEIFLEKYRLDKCKHYLATVRVKSVDDIQLDIDRYQRILHYLMKKKDVVFRLNEPELRKILFYIYDIIDELEEPDDSNPDVRLIDTLATSRLRFSSSGKIVEATIGELIILIDDGCKDNEITLESARGELKRYGIIVEGGFICIANRCKPMSILLKDTPWGSQWSKTLQDIKGAEKVGSRYYSPGIQSRGTKIPISILKPGLLG